MADKETIDINGVKYTDSGETLECGVRIFKNDDNQKITYIKTFDDISEINKDFEKFKDNCQKNGIYLYFHKDLLTIRNLSFILGTILAFDTNKDIQKIQYQSKKTIEEVIGLIKELKPVKNKDIEVANLKMLVDIVKYFVFKFEGSEYTESIINEILSILENNFDNKIFEKINTKKKIELIYNLKEALESFNKENKKYTNFNNALLKFQDFIVGYEKKLCEYLPQKFINEEVFVIDTKNSQITINLKLYKEQFGKLSKNDIPGIDKLTERGFSFEINAIDIDDMDKALNIFGEVIDNENLKKIKQCIVDLLEKSDDAIEKLTDFIIKSRKDDIIEKIEPIILDCLKKITDSLSKKIESEEVKIVLENKDFSKSVAESLIKKINTKKYFTDNSEYNKINGIISKIEESDKNSLKLIAKSIVTNFDGKGNIDTIIGIIEKAVSENQKFSELVLDELFKKIDDKKYESIRDKITEKILKKENEQFSASLANSLANFIVNNKNNDLNKEEFDIISKMELEKNENFLNHVADLLAIRTLFVETDDKNLKEKIKNYHDSNFGILYNEKIIEIEELKEKLDLNNINCKEGQCLISKKFFNKLKKEQGEEIEEIKYFDKLCNIIFDYNKLNNKKITLDFDKDIKEEAKKGLNDSTFKILLGLYEVHLPDDINQINNIGKFDDLYKKLDGGAGYFVSLEGILRNHIKKAADNFKNDKNNTVTELAELYKKNPIICRRLTKDLVNKDNFERAIIKKAKGIGASEYNKENKNKGEVTRTGESNKYDWFVNKLRGKYDAEELGINKNEYEQTIKKLAGYYCEGNQKRSKLIDEAVNKGDYKYLEVLCEKIAENKKYLNQVIRGKISKILRRKYEKKIEKYNEIVKNAELYLNYTAEIKDASNEEGKNSLKKCRKDAYKNLKKLAGISFIFPIFRTKARIEKMLENAEKHLEKYNSGILIGDKVVKETIEKVEPVKTKTASLLDRIFPESDGRY